MRAATYKAIRTWRRTDVAESLIDQAIAYWLAPPGDRAERVAVVVAKDPSTVRLDPVLRVIARERTDLLQLVLTQGALAGRFGHENVAYVPTAPAEWTRRWTGRQRSAHLVLLHRLAGAGRTPDRQRASAVRSIGEVPGVSAAELRRYPESANASLRRAALTAAPHIGAPQDVLPDLLALASSDDAHVATYAATRAARFVPPGALADALSPVINEGKITARKEALRLLIAHRVPGTG